MPTPVRPAITAGIQAPLGVTETTQPSSSAASIEVVPRKNASSTSRARALASSLVTGQTDFQSFR